MQVFFYLTPVMYPKEFMRDRYAGQLMQAYNPLTPFLRLLRDAVLENGPSPAPVYLAACSVVAVAAGAAAVSLWNLERRLVFQL